MRVLVACEYSGIVRDAFIAKGHEAMSCDILDTESPGPHYKGNVLDVLNDGWDMMIAFPPCTYLTHAGIGHFNVERYGQKAIDRKVKQQEAFEFFKLLYNAPIKKICLENPVGYVNGNYQKPTQIIHPYYFGDKNLKKTCLWLKGLPPLQHYRHTDLFNDKTHTDLPEPDYTHERKPGKHYKGGEVKKRYFVDTMRGNHVDRAHRRSKTFPGIANAMATQWGLNKYL